MTREGYKRCLQCHEEKPLSEFHRNSTARDGLAYRCKACRSAANRARRAANPEKTRVRERAWYEKHREKINAKRRAMRKQAHMREDERTAMAGEQTIIIDSICAADVPPPTSLIRVTKTGFVMLSCPYDYEVPKRECQRRGQILGWVHHLSEKNWCDRRALHQFIDCAARAAGIGIYATDQEQLALGCKEAAKVLGISERTLFTLTGQGDIPSFTVGTRRLYSTAALRTWVAGPSSHHSTDDAQQRGGGSEHVADKEPASRSGVSLYQPRYRDRRGAKRAVTTWYLAFTNHEGIACHLATALRDRTAANTFADRIAQLLNARTSNTEPPADVVTWCAGLPVTIQDRLRRYDIIQARVIDNIMTVDERVKTILGEVRRRRDKGEYIAQAEQNVLVALAVLEAARPRGTITMKEIAERAGISIGKARSCGMTLMERRLLCLVSPPGKKPATYEIALPAAGDNGKQVPEEPAAERDAEKGGTIKEMMESPDRATRMRAMWLTLNEKEKTDGRERNKSAR